MDVLSFTYVNYPNLIFGNKMMVPLFFVSQNLILVGSISFPKRPSPNIS